MVGGKNNTYSDAGVTTDNGNNDFLGQGEVSKDFGNEG